MNKFTINYIESGEEKQFLLEGDITYSIRKNEHTSNFTCTLYGYIPNYSEIINNNLNTLYDLLYNNNVTRISIVEEYNGRTFEIFSKEKNGEEIVNMELSRNYNLNPLTQKNIQIALTIN